jgi:citrate synthase
MSEAHIEPWRTAIVDARDGHIRIRGYDIATLMTGKTFTDTIFLLHRGELPTPAERRILDAILTAIADHGSGAPSCATARLAASGNRQSLSAAVAAGILAVGDDHGGAGSGCMELIVEGLALARERSLSFDDAARQLVARTREQGRRLPGFGHRVHHTDPRTAILLDLARAGGVTGDGVAFIHSMERAIEEMVKRLPLNVDGALAAVLHDMGFTPPFGRLVFLIGRVAGLTAEVAEELSRERPMRIRIPVEYDGTAPRTVE